MDDRPSPVRVRQGDLLTVMSSRVTLPSTSSPPATAGKALTAGSDHAAREAAVTSLPPAAAGKFFLIDGHSYAYQAYYAIGGMQTPSGAPVGVVFGFTQLIERLLEQKPTHLAAVFDAGEETFRTARYADYKVQRPPMPEDLASQILQVKEVLAAYRIPVLELEGYEADDIIGTLAKEASRRGIATLIISKDKDLEQLLDPFIHIYDPKDGKLLGVDELKAKKGLRPDQVVEYLALVGDSSDNIPGVDGIGAKTALKILSAVPTLDDAFRGPVPGLPEKVMEKLRAGKESAELSRALATLHLDCPLPGGRDPELFALKAPDRAALAAHFQRFRFLRLLEKYSRDADRPCLEAAAGAALESPSTGEAAPPPVPLPSSWNVARTREEIQALSARLCAAPYFAMDTETDGLDPFRDRLVGLSFARFEDDAAARRLIEEPLAAEAADREARTLRVEAWYVPLRAPEPLEVAPEEALEALRPALEDPAAGKVGQNIKFDVLFYRAAGIAVRPVVFDTMVASYLLNPEVRAHNLDVLALDYLNHRKIPLESLLGTGKSQITMDRVALEKIRDYSCEDADVTLRLQAVLGARLREAGLLALMEEVEMPLVEVLADMEWNGIAIDRERLAAMGERIRGDLGTLTREIQGMAGSELNVASPPQLAEVLFGKLGLPAGPKGKSGFASTAADVLEALRDRHPIVPRILEHRELTKLLGTYVEALPELLNPRTGRIHTSFNQTVAATGRLSSSGPNLQNIPIKTELGREIRKAFIAGGPDLLLLSADYSQVELRVLAHLSEDAALGEAFRAGADIHAAVAAQLYGVRPEDVQPSMRRLAKAVNFGIIYGQTPYGLSQELGVPVEEAAEVIRGYFGRHPGVRAFIDRTIARAREEGCVRTILGRRRPIRDIASRNPQLRAMAERTAVNSVVQGSAADLIKVAMNNIHTDQEERRSRARLLLQIHDELLLEVPREDLAVERERVREEMVRAMELRVPLEVNLAWGESWYEAKD